MCEGLLDPATNQRIVIFAELGLDSVAYHACSKSVWVCALVSEFDSPREELSLRSEPTLSNVESDFMQCLSEYLDQPVDNIIEDCPR